jgi:hypothetical protein
VRATAPLLYCGAISHDRIHQNCNQTGLILYLYNIFGAIYYIKVQYKIYTMADDANGGVEMAVVASILLSFLLVILPELLGVERAPSTCDQRMVWENIVLKQGNQATFKRHLRMSAESFDKLLSYIRPLLEADEIQGARREGGHSPRNPAVLHCSVASWRFLLRYISIRWHLQSFFLSCLLANDSCDLHVRRTETTLPPNGRRMSRSGC